MLARIQKVCQKQNCLSLLILLLFPQSQQQWQACLASLDAMRALLEPGDAAGLVTSLQLRAGVKHELKEYNEALLLLQG